MRIFLLILTISPLILFSQTWQDVDGGTNSSSHGLLVWDEKLVDLGSFNNPCNRVATWDGTVWECLDNGVGIVARAGTVWNGNLIVVGDFWNVFQPCTNCNGVAMWDGTQWTNIGAGFNNDVLCVTVWNGDLVAAGDFTESNGVPCSRIARWTGSVWEQIGPSNAFNNDIRAITEFEGELWIGGDFTNVGGCTACDRLVKWDGSTWVGGDVGVDIQGGVDNTVRVLYVNQNDGKLYMGGHFVDLNLDGVVNTDCRNIAVYDGSNWTPLGTGVNDYVRAIHEYNGTVVAGGYFTEAGGISANRIARFNPTTSVWSPMGQGFDGAGIDEYVKSAAVYQGTFFAGGAYTVAEGGPMNFISQWYEAPTAAPIAFINASQTSICAGSCINFSDLSTYAPTSWTWTIPGGSITSSTNQIPGSVCFATAGTYTVSLQACNLAGCNTTTQNITVTSGSTISVNNPTTCIGSTTLLTANPSVFGGTYLWSPGGQTLQSISVSPTVTTPYTVTYTVSGCGSITGSGTVTVGPAPTVTVNSPTICLGGSTVLTATPSTGGGSYLWSPGGQTTSTITVSPTVTTTYSVVYTLNGCTSLSADGTVTISGGATATVNNASICSGNPATLTATPSSGGGTYLWSPGGQVTPSITISPLATTTYSVIYTLAGCPGTSATGTVTVSTTPAVSVNNVSMCNGSSATLTASPSVGGGTYLWSPGGQTTSTITVSPTVTTTYSVIYTLNSCPSSSISGTVTVNQIPTVTVNNQTICSGNSTTLTATPSISGGSYLWAPGGQTTSFITINPTSTTSYSVVYTLNGCQSPSASGTVTVNTTPSVNVNNSSICAGSSTTLTTTPSVGGGSYLWTPTNETTQSIVVSPTNNATYSVVYTLNGCPSATAISTVTVTQIPTVTVNNQTICSGNSTTLTATPSISGGSYLWSPDNQVTQSINVFPIVNSSYTVVYTLNGCVSNSATSNVSIITGPSTVVTTSQNILTAEQDGATYQWLDCLNNNDPISGENNQTYQALVNGEYSVELSFNGCLDTSDCMLINTNALAENDFISGFQVFPNPTDDQINIIADESFVGLTLVLRDQTGKMIKEILINNKLLEVSLKDLSPGIYFGKLNEIDNTVIRLVKQ